MRVILTIAVGVFVGVIFIVWLYICGALLNKFMSPGQQAESIGEYIGHGVSANLLVFILLILFFAIGNMTLLVFGIK
jgi:hypothetical protein